MISQLKQGLFLLLVCSCALAQTVVEKYNLPDILEETSGLAILNDTLWTLNDSGNEAAL